MKLPSSLLSRMNIECGVIKGLFTLESHKAFIEMNSGPHYKISKSDIFRQGASESLFEPTSPHKITIVFETLLPTSSYENF